MVAYFIRQNDILPSEEIDISLDNNGTVTMDIEGNNGTETNMTLTMDVENSNGEDTNSTDLDRMVKSITFETSNDTGNICNKTSVLSVTPSARPTVLP